MISVNDLLQSESIRHMVALQRYDNSVVARIIALLNRSDRRLMAELSERLESMDAGSFTMQRLESIITSVWSLNTQAYAELGRAMDEEVKQFVAYETSYQAQMLKTHVPAVVHVASVSAEQAYAAALARPFQGVVLRDVWGDLDATKRKRVRQAIANGFVEGKTTDQIVRELRGTRANGYTDGVIQKDRRDVETVVRTAMGHTAASAQNQVEQANTDIIKYIRWSSTLDNRTSSPCRLRDGKLYTPGDHKPVGHSYPWGAGAGAFHWNCRSSRIFVLRSHSELGIDVPDVVVTGRQRASMDGAVPADVTYQQWLMKQSAARQDDILGPTRAKLMRDGGMDLESFSTKNGRPLTLDELRKRDAEAFERAGV